ncbi:nucleoside kinase [Clostridium sp. BJN0001]|uniref:nucleoside kinase n=1 Tax=Clostridium sp. BJN0001 TaxID=2930219 RepID=UPI001FD517EA|nr:nucleoside kinase [Clostridium sp. BJN0001]
MKNELNVIKAEKGITFYELLKKNDKINERNIAVCKLNDVYHSLGDRIEEEGEVYLIPFTMDFGMKIYVRTLQFIFVKAALDIFPNSKVKIEHSISKGLFGEIRKESPLTEEEILKIKNRMCKLINQSIVINKKTVSKEYAIKYFEKIDMDDKVSLLEHLDLKEINLYELDGRYGYFYGFLAYSTGFIKTFDLMYYEGGFILRRPSKYNLDTLSDFKEQKSLTNIFRETEKWLNILGIETVGSLNRKIENNRTQNIVLVSEALHEKKIAYIADEISNRKSTKVVFIAGPSSSGKTTFSKRLSIQLRVNGLIPITLSMDDYFLDRDETPKDENGDYDYETINALDLNLFNRDLTEILQGKEVNIPTFNFKLGKKEWLGNKVILPQNGVLIIEGIHGLNPLLTKRIPKDKVFKIYISALTQLNIDYHNRISTTDVRKLRRIVRDSLSRGYGAEETLKMWSSIKRGEKSSIFIYQEEADAMFNSTLLYELSVLKPYALNELSKISKDSDVYLEASRLKEFLELFKEIDEKYIPENSLLREFIGGSCFYEY